MTAIVAGARAARGVHVDVLLLMPSNRVLIVEDDPDVRAALEHLFTKHGYAVALASNGAEAIDLLDRDGPPCAVLVDLLMPGIVGHELLEYMRGDAAFRNIPIAIISGSPQLAPEGYHVFPKPLDAQRLLEFVRSCPLTPDPRAAA